MSRIVYYSVRDTSRQYHGDACDGELLVHDATQPFAVVAVARIDRDTWRAVQVLSRHTTRSGAARSANCRNRKMHLS